MITLEFPWPPSALSPNARVHWATKAKAAKKYKEDCGWVCRSIRDRHTFSTPPRLQITFCPPDKRRRDGDNLIASVKHLIDAISDWIGIDDSQFTLGVSKSSPVKNGAVKVVIS